MDNIQKLKLPFDEIYCINLIEREDRYNKMIKIFNHLGITENVKFHRAVKHPFCDKISTFIRDNKLGEIWGNAFSCTREHYTIIKSAYLRGINTIMIIEDDCCFYKDIQELQKYFDNLPNDWDILRVNCLRGSTEERHFNKPENINKLWDREFISTLGTGCYCLNRNGMKYMINYIDNRYDAIDIPLCYYVNSKLNTYISNRPLGLQFPEQSDIQDTTPLNHYYYKDIKNIDLTMYQYD